MTGAATGPAGAPPPPRSRLARNTALNLGTQVGLMAVGFLCLPVLVGHLTAEEFGLLSVVWVFIGYFSILDFGISGAATKFLAELIALGRRVEAARLARSALAVSLLLGLLSAALVLALRGVLVDRVFHVPPAMRGAAWHVLFLAAMSIPATVAFGTLKGVQIAFQRFDIANALQGALGLAQWLGSAAALWAGFGLGEILLLTLVARVAVALVSLALLPRLLPEVRERAPWLDAALLKKVFGYGGWVTVVQVVSPVQFFADRVIIGAVLSLAWVTYFAVPMDALIKLLVVPLSVAGALFPHISGQWTTEEGRALASGHIRLAMKYTYVVLLPVLALLLLFREPLLRLWVGEQFVERSGGVFAVVCAGLMLHAMSQIPSVALQAIGRPRVIAVLLLVEFPFYLGLCYALTSRFGIVGTAAAWFARVAVETTVLFVALAGRMARGGGGSYVYLWKAGAAVLAGGTAVALLQPGGMHAPLAVGLAAAFAALYAAVAWWLVLDGGDRGLVARLSARPPAGRLP